MKLAASLRDIIAGRFNTARDGRHYTWTRLVGAKNIQQAANWRTEVGAVTVENSPYVHDGTFHSRERLKECMEAIEYSDGCIIMCALMTEFAGTFASHDDVEVHYWLLEPTNAVAVE